MQGNAVDESTGNTINDLRASLEKLNEAIREQVQAQVGELPDDVDIFDVSIGLVNLMRFVKGLPERAQDLDFILTGSADKEVAYTVNIVRGVHARAWIPVTERLPEPNRHVVIWHVVNDILVERRIAHRLPDDEGQGIEFGLWRLHGDPGRMYAPGAHIRYWCPLPDGPSDVFCLRDAAQLLYPEEHPEE